MEKETYISVIKEHQNLIYKICFTYCSEEEDRRDLQQEILIQLWNALSKYDGRVKMSTWVYRIALNTAISFYRSGRKHKSNKQTLDESIISLPDMSENTELNEQIAMLYQVIEQMNSLEKALILLYLDGNKYRDIAEIMGITETNVATKISRIKQQIKEKFNQN